MTALLPESKIINEEVQEMVSEAFCLPFKRKLGREDVNKQNIHCVLISDFPPSRGLIFMIAQMTKLKPKSSLQSRLLMELPREAHLSWCKAL